MASEAIVRELEDAALLSYARPLALLLPPPLPRVPRDKRLRPALIECDDQCLGTYYVAKNHSLDPKPAPPPREPTVNYVKLNSEWRQSLFGRYVMTGGLLRPPWS
jgi:hypothetical protein